MADDLFESDIDDDDLNEDDDDSDNYITISESDEDDDNFNPLGVFLGGSFFGGHRFWMDDFLDDALDDYEDDDYDSDQSDWLEDDEEFDMEGVALWQANTGRDSPIREEHLIQSKSINIFDHLKSREIGETKFLKANKRTTLLSYSLMPCWTSVSRVDMLLNAKALLGRRLYRWEGAVLDFFQRRAMERNFDAGPRKTALSILLNECEGIVPITFTDIVDVLLKTGAQLDATNVSGHGVLLDFLKYNELHEDSADFFDHLLRHCGLDVKKDAEEAVRLLCESFRDGPITNAKLRVLEMMFAAGLELSEAAKRDSIAKFTRNILKEANQTAVKVLALLLKHGCHPNEALLTMDNLDYPFDSPRSADRFDCILTIADMLLENGAQVNVSPDDPWRLSFLFKILDSARREPRHASILDFLKKCVDRGFDLSVTGNSLKNFLMGFCEKYKNEDLPQVIRFLCSKGVDVNAKDRYERNALFYLAENEPANRQTIYEAVATLIELGIDVKHADSSGCTIFIKFLSNESTAPCCYYKGLKCLNESCFWDILDLLVDAGVDVNRREDDSYGALHMVLDHLTGLKSESGTICEECFTSDFASASKEEALANLGTNHFERALKFMQRLIKAGAQVGNFSAEYETPLLYVCSHFGGEQLISLVRLLCESGVNVNEKTASFLSDHPSKRINAIGVLREVNRTQAHLADRLIDIMKPYGFKV